MSSIFAITGNPVNHSKSPALFRAAYQALPDMEYILLPADTANEAIRLFKTQNILGINVTAPFKTDILQYVNKQSNEVEIIGAANTIVKQNNGLLTAYNTDYLGVLGAFAEFNITLKNKRCLILGVGGAGKAAAYALINAGGCVLIANRTLSNAESFAEKIGARAIALSDIKNEIAGYDIIVNTLYPSIDCIDKESLQARQVVMDASYIGSPLLSKAKQQGCVCIDGRYWVLHQAVPAFELFTGIKPDIEAMRKVVTI